ncbi:MAG TPA: acyltransferase [Actinomycetota bacterium]|nr:acyltransferase [Actinomycetota bacterium]
MSRTRVAGPVRGRGVEGLAAVPPARPRLVYLDNVKALLIAGIIASHAIQGYSEFGSWTYQDFQEVTLSPVVETVFVVAMMSLGALFLMALFFLISGLFTQDSLARKGASRFVSDRLLRLGVPFAIYTLLVWPLLEYSLFGPLMHRGFWDSYLDTHPVLDNGPMWFVGVLLLYSLGLAGLRRWFPRPATPDRELRWRHLVLLSLAVGVATFLLRTVFPADSGQPLNLHLWGWPEYVAMFGLGVVAARHGWLRPVPDALARRCGIAALVAIAAVTVSVVSAEPLGLDEDAFFGGWRWTALLAAMAEGVLSVSAPIWVLAFARRHLNGVGRVRRAAARSSYLAFMLQGPVLVALALALRPIDLSGDVKALLVAALGIVGSFALAWPVVTRTPLRRFL